MKIQKEVVYLQLQFLLKDEDIYFKILLAEDDEALRFIVKDNLEHQNYNVEVAENGEVALQLFRQTNFDLIILDVMLPKIDGFQVAETIRETNDQVPIIFLTARSMTEDKIKGLTIGGDDYIPKPFSMEELLLKIKIFLKRSQALPVEEPAWRTDKNNNHRSIYFSTGGTYTFNKW